MVFRDSKGLGVSGLSRSPCLETRQDLRFGGGELWSFRGV